MLVVDTNVLAYLLIEGDRTREARELLSRDADWRSDGFILVEFSNILATYQRVGALTGAQSEALMSEAETRMRRLVQLPHAQALKVARELQVSAYDARFVGAARGLGARLVTEDAKLRGAARADTLSISEALG